MNKEPHGLSIESSRRGNVRIITVTYEELSLFHELKAPQLTEQILREYHTGAAPGVVASCVVVLKATVATSAVVFALYELFKECSKERGQLFIVGYPKDYIQSLSSLGFTDLHGFELVESVEAATSAISGSEKSLE